MPGFYMTGWFGLFAPKGTPRTAIGKLSAAMAQVLADRRTSTRFAELGIDVAPRSLQSPEELTFFAIWKSKRGGRSSRLRGLAH